MQACLKSVEISVDPDQLASSLRFSVPHCFSKTDILRFSVIRFNILDPEPVTIKLVF